MNLLDVELVNEPLEIDSFSYLSDSEYPVIMLGFQLKNLYDQKRLLIKDKYDVQDIIHFIPRETMLPKFFRGIKLTIKPSIVSLIAMLENLGLSDREISLPTYRNILDKYKLSCNNCYAFLQKGIYPIDSECINSFASNYFNLEEIYSMIDNKKIQTFQAASYPVIYVLSNKNVYRTTNNNFLHAVVKKYRNE